MLKQWRVTYKALSMVTREEVAVKTATVTALTDADAGMIVGLDVLDAGYTYRLVDIQEVKSNANQQTSTNPITD